jgi:hypothetical protein
MISRRQSRRAPPPRLLPHDLREPGADRLQGPVRRPPAFVTGPGSGLSYPSNKATRFGVATVLASDRVRVNGKLMKFAWRISNQNFGADRQVRRRGSRYIRIAGARECARR